MTDSVQANQNNSNNCLVFQTHKNTIQSVGKVLAVALAIIGIMAGSVLLTGKLDYPGYDPLAWGLILGSTLVVLTVGIRTLLLNRQVFYSYFNNSSSPKAHHDPFLGVPYDPSNRSDACRILGIQEGAAKDIVYVKQKYEHRVAALKDRQQKVMQLKAESVSDMLEDLIERHLQAYNTLRKEHSHLSDSQIEELAKPKSTKTNINDVD